MQEDRVPKIFISYSWSSDTLVVPLAERLVSHGIDVVLDKWDLKAGQDKYAFMEQCVNNPDITKVLIICDKSYADKADARTGGVGDETVIISSEVYGNMTQEKFIPIIAERDEDGNSYVPAYMKARIYIDLSSEGKYEEEYEKLLRNIYQKPLYRKPALGNRPNWLDEEKTNLFPLADLIRQIKGVTSEKKLKSCVNKFIEEYIGVLKTYFINGTPNGEAVYSCFMEMKTVRDIFLDFLIVLGETDLPFSEVVCNAFEKMHNTLTCAKGFNPNAQTARDTDYEIYKIHIWELFICTTAYLRHVQNYKAINELVTNTYFLTTSSLNNNLMPTNYCAFRHHSSIIENNYKPKTPFKNKFTLLGNSVCCEREKFPIFTGEALAEADVFLYQIRNAFNLAEDKHRWGDSYWFPTCYVYAKTWPTEWERLISRKFCLKMYELFGVNDLENLKAVLSRCIQDKEMCYPGSFETAPAILTCVKLEDIDSVN